MGASVSIFNIANMLSFLRIILAVPLVMNLEKLSINSEINLLYKILFIILIIVITDLLDGYVARLYGQITNLGKLMDPVADKICLLVVFIYLIFEIGIPFLIFFIILSLRDLFVGLIAVYFISFKDNVFQSNNSGKWFLGIFSLSALLFILDIPDIVTIPYLFHLKWSTYIISALLFIISSKDYIQRYIIFGYK